QQLHRRHRVRTLRRRHQLSLRSSTAAGLVKISHRRVITLRTPATTTAQKRRDDDQQKALSHNEQRTGAMHLHSKYQIYYKFYTDSIDSPNIDSRAWIAAKICLTLGEASFTSTQDPMASPGINIRLLGVA